MNRIRFAIDAARDKCFAQYHLLATGMGPFCVDGFSLPCGLAKGLDYWIIVPLIVADGETVPDPHFFRLAQSYRNAVDGVPIDLTTPGIGPFELSGHRITWPE